MKKYLSVVLALVLVLSLAACAAPKADGNDGDSGAETGTPSAPETVAAPTAPEAAAATPAGTQVPSEEDVHSPAPAEADNIIPHEPEGYCGNTVTTIKFDGVGTHEEEWEKSIWGDDSVRITDLLRFLDYSGDVCRCRPEYTVDTEFGDGYGINLSEGYARHDGRQVTLTQEQVTELSEIIERAKEQE